MDVATLISTACGGSPPFRVVAYDGSSAPGADGAAVTLVVRHRDALTRMLTHPGELGLARAYVAGDLDVEGDLDALFTLPGLSPASLARPAVVRAALELLGRDGLTPLPPPSIEARPRGVLHSRARDRAAVTYHYDVSNDFYELVLGESMTYSCAVFRSPDDDLADAQRRKVDLVARKLALRPASRLLDVGCGWGTMAIHAARTFGARVVGVTLSAPQAQYARERARREGLADLVDIRVCDYRDVDDEPFDAISSIGMSEHVGRRGLDGYVDRLYSLLRPGGRLLNHAIGRPVADGNAPRSRTTAAARQVKVALGLRGPSRIHSPFIERYVFPDGELHEAGTMVSLLQARGFEVRHLESLREHYALTLRRWIANLESHWDDAVAAAGEARARVWRLYMAGSAVGFERHNLEIHQVLAVRPGRRRQPVRASRGVRAPLLTLGIFRRRS